MTKRNRHRWAAALVATCAIASCSAFAQTQIKITPVQREALCAREARANRLTGTRFNQFMDRCTHPAFTTGSAAASPPVQPPSNGQPTQPSTTATPASKREADCRKAITEMGMTGAAAATYLQRCLSTH
jgi:hypothetical protein